MILGGVRYIQRTSVFVLLLLSVVIGFLELVLFILLNYVFYANVIDAAAYLILLPLSIIIGVFRLFGRPTIGALVNNVIYMLVPAVLFILAVPHYSYQQGQSLIVKHLNDARIEFAHTDVKTVVVTPRYSWLLADREYYYVVNVGDSSKKLYYLVNPLTGSVTATVASGN